MKVSLRYSTYIHVTILSLLKINNYWFDIQNNQGRGKGYQPKPKLGADKPYRDLDYSGYHKNRIQLLFYYTLNEKKWKSCFCFFTDGKQHEARALDMTARDLDMNYCII